MKTLHPICLPLLAGAIVATLVSGAKPDRIKDHHATHAKNDVACETCHAAAASKLGSDNLLPRIMDAVRAGATVGEISDEMRAVFGEHQEIRTL